MNQNSLLAVSVALLTSSLAAADPVDNPSDYTQTFDAGRIRIGNLDETDFIGVSVAGTVQDTAGDILIQADGVVVPDITVTAPLVGDVTLHFVSLSDQTGSLNAVTGDASFNISLRIFLVNPNFPPDCRVDEIDIALTTGTDGTLTGVAYSMDDGTATYVNNSFTVPTTSDCGFYGPLIDAYVGLPAGSGVNYINSMHGTYAPVFVGS
jgi:hypothetical protein